MNYLIILSDVILFAVQTISFKVFSLTYMKNAASYYLFNFLYFCMVVAILVITGGIPRGFMTLTIIMGMLFGILFVTVMLCYMKAMETGPLSFTVLFFSFALLIPVIFGSIIWKETIGFVQVAGLALLLATFYLGNASVKEPGRRVNMRWLIFCLAACIGNGTLMVLAKGHQMLLPGKDIKEFLIISFGAATLLSMVLFLWYHNGKQQSVTHLRSANLLLVVLAAGITTAFGNQLSLYLSSRVPAIIQFPMINGGIVILSTIASSLIFKEKLSLTGKTGLGLGIAALILLSVK